MNTHVGKDARRSIERKSFKEYLEEVEAEQRYLVVIVPGDYLAGQPLTEGWQESGIGDIVYRVDPPEAATKGQRHVHIAHRKHRRVKDKQVSWNQSGTRHDKKTFDDKFKPRKAAENLARKVLGLPDTAVLEHVTRSESLSLLLEPFLYDDDTFDDAIVLRLVG